MRWIDIFLPEPGTNLPFDSDCEEAAAIAADLGAIQDRDGLDAATVTSCMAAAGRILFQALIDNLPGALAPDPRRPGFAALPVGDTRHDELIGYHLIGHGSQLDLPWTWLHNGLEFMLAGHPISVGNHPSDPAVRTMPRPWMQHLARSRYLVGEHGRTTLPAILPQLLPTQSLVPEVLFVPGHGDRNIRRLIFREADAINSALDGGTMGRRLGRLHVPDGAVTPTDLVEKSLAYQGLHYAGPTSEALQYDQSQGPYWMNRILAEAAQVPDAQWEEMAGMEGEVLGVDPITSLLDDISERYEQRGVSVAAGGLARAAGSADHAAEGASGAERSAAGWLLQDGPVDPVRLGHRHGLPPLVFSNSYLALPQLGRRCTQAGASTFIGPNAALYSRPARHFAGRFYAAMAQGWCAGAALWRAATGCRTELGRQHPAWLSYGIHGYGCLALPYL